MPDNRLREVEVQLRLVHQGGLSAPSGANLRSKEGLSGALSRFLFGDDIFISYSRRDSTNYALSLANALTTQKLSCYLDQWGTPPGEDLPESLKTALRRSTLLVIVGTERAASSEAVSKEVAEFLKTERPIIPVSFEGSLEAARWFPLIRGLAIAEESTETLGSGTPSELVIRRIVNARGFTRRNARLRKLFLVTALAVALLLIAGAVAASAIVQRAQAKTQEAEARARVADAQAGSANQQAQAAEKRAIVATQNANNAEARAGDALERERDAAEREKLQRRIASSIQLANESSRSRGTTAESLVQSSLISLDSVEQHPTPEGSQELRNNLALMPRRILQRNLPENVRDVAISPDGRHIAIVMPDGKVEIQRTDSGEVIDKIELEPPRRAEVAKEQTTSWSLVIDGPTMALSNDGRFLAVVRGAKMQVREVTGDRLRHWEVALPSYRRGLGWYLYGFAISPDGKYLATVIGGVFSGNVQVWSVEGGQMVVELSEESQLGSQFQGMKRVAFSATGKHLSAAGKNACVWAISSYSSERPLTKNSFSRIDTPAQYSEVQAIAPGPDDRFFAASSNGSIRIWKRRSRNSRLGDFEEAARMPASGNLIAFGSDGERLYVANRTSVQIWETSGPWETMHMQHGREIVNVAFSPQGNQVITISGDSARDPYGPYKYEVRRWSSDNPTEESVIFRFEIKSWDSQEFQLTDDGRYLVLRGVNNSVEIWDLSEQPSVRTIPYPSELKWVDSMRISPDGQWIALIGKTGRPMFDYKHDTMVLCSVVSPDHFVMVDTLSRVFGLSAGGNYLLRLDSNNRPVACDVRTGRKTTLNSIEHLSRIERMQFSPKGKYLAVATRSEIYILESGSWRIISKIQHPDLLERLRFSPDDRYLGTVNSHLSVQVWETATGVRLASLDHVGQVSELAFSFNGKYVATAHGQAVGTRPFNLRRAHFLRLSLLQSGDLADELCRRLHSNFSDEQLKQYAGGRRMCGSED